MDPKTAAKALLEGKIVAVPTETVYGLAGSIFNEDALRAIFEAKGRPLMDPLILHVHDLKAAERLATFSDDALRLADAFWPGALTLVLPKKDAVSSLITAGKETVALRSPKHPTLRAILEISGPLAAPSANPFGYVSPTEAQHVRDSLGDRIDGIVEGGAATIGLESTIVDLSYPTDAVSILRTGAITREMLEAVLEKPVQLTNHIKAESEHDIKAPGMLEQHYSPHTRLLLADKQKAASGKVAYVRFDGSSETMFDGEADYYALSPNGNLDDAAKTLFGLLQTLDRQNYDTIVIEEAPEKGIGLAINDRLKRAAAKRY